MSRQPLAITGNVSVDGFVDGPASEVDAEAFYTFEAEVDGRWYQWTDVRPEIAGDRARFYLRDGRPVEQKKITSLTVELPETEFVGGPANGRKVARPRASKVVIPIPGMGPAAKATTGIGQFTYTLRRCRRADGSVVEILAPAGQEVDRAWLAKNGLTN